MATIASVSVASLLTLAKLGAWLLTGSIAILSGALDSLMDLLGSAIILYAVLHAARPADAHHRYGHGKAEPLAGLALSAFVGGSGLLVLIFAVDRLIHPVKVQSTAVGLAVIGFSIALSLGLVVFQRHVARVTRSAAIAADSLHYMSDLLINLAVVAMLLAYRWTDLVWLDPLVALLIAGYLGFGAWRIGRRCLDMLMDRELPLGDRERIEDIVRSVDDVRGIHDLRTRSSGPARFVEFHLEMDGKLRLSDAHAVAHTVESALMTAFPGADVVIHQEPEGLRDLRRDRAIGAQARGGASSGSESNTSRIVRARSCLE